MKNSERVGLYKKELISMALTYWNYLTVDWYAKYSDYIKASSMPTVDADKNYQSMMGIRDLRDRAVLQKIMSVT